MAVFREVQVILNEPLDSFITLANEQTLKHFKTSVFKREQFHTCAQLHFLQSLHALHSIQSLHSLHPLILSNTPPYTTYTP